VWTFGQLTPCLVEVESRKGSGDARLHHPQLSSRLAVTVSSGPQKKGGNPTLLLTTTYPSPRPYSPISPLADGLIKRRRLITVLDHRTWRFFSLDPLPPQLSLIVSVRSISSTLSIIYLQLFVDLERYSQSFDRYPQKVSNN
jgi:hypothetical protein